MRAVEIGYGDSGIRPLACAVAWGCFTTTPVSAGAGSRHNSEDRGRGRAGAGPGLTKITYTGAGTGFVEKHWGLTGAGTGARASVGSYPYPLFLPYICNLSFVNHKLFRFKSSLPMLIFRERKRSGLVT